MYSGMAWCVGYRKPGGNPSCWHDIFDFDYCCDRRHGPTGASQPSAVTCCDLIFDIVQIWMIWMWLQATLSAGMATTTSIIATQLQ